MATFARCERDQAFLRPLDMNDWLPSDDLAHFVIAAAERVSMSAFQVNDRNSGKPHYHPRMMLALPGDLARRETVKAKFEAAYERMEAESGCQAEAARPAYEAKKAAYDAKKGRRGRPPKPPDDTPPPERQSNLTDPDSALMRRSDAHEYRQADNAQAVVCADGSQLILATNLVATSADAPSFAETILGMQGTVGLPDRILPDTGCASGPVVAALQAQGVEPLVAIGRTQPH